jgi:CBS domain-containing protein
MIAAATPFEILDCEVTLLSAAQLMLKKNLKRIGVTSEGGDLIGVLSQSQLLKFVLSHLEKFSFLEKTIKELQLGYKDEIYSIDKSFCVKDAFLLMRQMRVSGVPILDQGSLLGNISLSDFKLSTSLNLRGFLNLQLEEYHKLKPYHLHPEPLYVTPETRASELMKKLKCSRVHRMFILDEKKLIGVVSHKDLIKCLISE